MATPAYDHFSDSAPATTDGITALAQGVRDNDQAMRDAVLMGWVPGWSLAYTYSGDQIATVTATKGSEVHKKTFTWGSTGGAVGKPTSVLWQWSNDGGTTWDTVSVATLTWNADGTLASVTQTAA